MDAFDRFSAAQSALTDHSDSDFADPIRLCDCGCGAEDDGEFNSLQGRWLAPDCWDREFRKTYRAEAVPVRRAG